MIGVVGSNPTRYYIYGVSVKKILDKHTEYPNSEVRFNSFYSMPFGRVAKRLNAWRCKRHLIEFGSSNLSPPTIKKFDFYKNI